TDPRGGRADVRHAAYGLIVIGQPIERAEAGGSRAQDRQRHDRAGEVRQERPWVVAGGDDAVLGRKLKRTIALGQDGAERGRRPGERLRQRGIVGRPLSELLLDLGAARRLRQELHHVLRAGGVGLREYDIDRNGGSAELAEPRDERRDGGARPGPLTDAAQRFIVDRHDADWRLRIPYPRIETLVPVEHDVAEIGQEWEAYEPDDGDRDGHCDDG